MATKTIQEERTVTTTLSALECDICSKVYAKTEMPPVGSGRFTVVGVSGQVSVLRKVLDLCPGCTGVTWDWLQEKKVKP